MKIFSSILLIFTIFLTNKTTTAQETNSTKEIAFWGDVGAYHNKQLSKMYKLIDSALTENPPTIGAPITRMLALYNFDAIVHETKYDNSTPFYDFVNSRIGKVIAELSTPVKKGIKLYKVYNEGFVSVTKSSTIAFDLVHGICQGQKVISEEFMKQIVDRCDILFITHLHGDHADIKVVEKFLNGGKPVIVPSNLWPDDDRLIHVRSESIIEKKVKLANGAEIEYKVLPGHQSDLLNNIYVVTTPENKSIAHVGDQYNKEDFEWIEGVKYEIPKLDALIINCWTYRIADFIEYFDPKLVVTAHENEMSHTIDHREAFWLTFQKMEPIKHDYIVMGWGEWYLIP